MYKTRQINKLCFDNIQREVKIIKIYADVFFIVNLFIDLILLSCVKRFFHLKTKGIRLFSASLTGGITSLIVLSGINEAIIYFILILSAFIISGMAFGFKIKSLIRNSVCFLVFSFIFSGINLLLINIFNVKAAVISGKVYYNINLLELLFFTALFYIIFTFCEKLKKNKEEHRLFYKVKINYKNCETEITMKLDTGLEVKEPFSEDPVILCEKEALSFTPDEKNKRLIPYRTVKGEGILWAFKPDEIYVEGIKSTKSIYVALYEDSLKSKNYHGLIPTSIL